MRLPVESFAVAVLCACSQPAGHPDGLPFAAFYERVQKDAMGFSCHDGDWTEDMGDAAYYGPLFYVTAGKRYGRDDYVKIGEMGYSHDVAVLKKASSDAGYLFQGFEEVLMAILGVTEVMAVSGRTDGLADLDAVLDQVNGIAETFGTYLDVQIESYALKTYGPTTITAVTALMNLRYAELLKTPRSKDRLARGLAVLDVIDGKAWDGARYLIRPGDGTLEIYPNVSMIIANVVAHELTGDERYRTRAIGAYDAIQPLKDPVKKNYRSPYSAATMGAKTDDYSTLSSQNYAMMALALLFQATGDKKYRNEITEIAGFIEKYLYVDGRILHHWIDGHIAQPSDPEYFCTGCNFQFLYVALYAEQYVY